MSCIKNTYIHKTREWGIKRKEIAHGEQHVRVIERITGVVRAQQHRGSAQLVKPTWPPGQPDSALGRPRLPRQQYRAQGCWLCTSPAWQAPGDRGSTGCYVQPATGLLFFWIMQKNSEDNLQETFGAFVLLAGLVFGRQKQQSRDWWETAM